MQWKYGLTENEKAFGTVVEWKNGKGIALVDNFGTSPYTEILLREEEIMFQCGQYFVPTNDVSKPVALGDVYKCFLVETEAGLLGLGARKVNELSGDWGGAYGTIMDLPRLIGVVQHWNFEKSYGFIESDHVSANLFFHKSEVLVPYEWLNDPFRAITMKLSPGNLVTFDAASTPRGMRALAVKRYRGEM